MDMMTHTQALNSMMVDRMMHANTNETKKRNYNAIDTNVYDDDVNYDTNMKEEEEVSMNDENSDANVELYTNGDTMHGIVVDEVKVADKTLMHAKILSIIHDIAQAKEEVDPNLDYCNECGDGGELLCCDICPRSYHLKCVTKNSQLPQDDEEWQCPFCQDSDPLPDLKVVRELSQAGAPLERICRAIITALLKFDLSHPFEAPVNPDEVPDYYDKIANPMDLKSMKKRVKEYETLDELYRDMVLIRTNCHTFNPKGSAITRMADAVFQVFETLLTQVANL